MNRVISQTNFFIGLLLLVLVLVYLMLAPFLAVVLLAAVFAVTLFPLRHRLAQYLSLGSGLASFLVIFLTFLVLVAALSFLVSRIFIEARDFYFSFETNPAGFLPQVESYLNNFVQKFWPQFDLDLTSYFRQMAGWLTSSLQTIFSSTFGLLLKALLWFMALYYFLKDGPKFVKNLIDLSPLNDHYDQQIIDRVRSTINSVIRGFLLVALAQGFLSGLGFAVFGVPQPVLWGSLAIFSAFIPGVGTALVNLPAIVYLWLSGSPALAIGLLIWAVVIVGLVDNLLAPYLYSRGGPIHPFIMLLGVLGGVILFGPAGFILGPVLLSVLFTLILIYRQGEI